jgi:hypothetical protein
MCVFKRRVQQLPVNILTSIYSWQRQLDTVFSTVLGWLQNQTVVVVAPLGIHGILWLIYTYDLFLLEAFALFFLPVA